MTKHPGQTDGPFTTVAVGADERQGAQDGVALTKAFIATGGRLTRAAHRYTAASGCGAA
jgi:hypothetical protein